MPTGGLIVGAAAPVVGGILGNLLGSGDRDKAQKASQAALEAITGVSLPTIEEQKIALEKLVSAGQLTPEQVATITQGNTELSEVSTDPRLKDAQMGALSSLVQQGNEGLTDTDRAALNEVRRSNDRDVNAKNQAILQNMAARGMGGSGAELASQLINSQEGADRASQEADRLAAQAQQNRLAAISASGQLGGQIRSQDYNEKSAAAQAQDAINRFNAQNSQQVATNNVATNNAAQQYNLNNAQRISDTNVGLANEQEMHNKGLFQQDFNNRMGKATAVSNAQNNIANTYNNQAAQTQNMWNNVGQGVGKAGLAVGAYAANQPKGSGSAKNVAYPTDDDWRNLAHGGMVEGPRVVPGTSEKNDIIPAMLSDKEMVLPEDIAHSKDDKAILAFIKHARKKPHNG